MRRRLLLGLCFVVLGAGGVAVGCGYEGQTTASPEAVEGPVRTETTPTTTTETTETTETETTETTETTTTETLPIVEGNATAGAKVFADTGCGACHTLSAANATGTIGPNLDDTTLSEAEIVATVTNGRPGTQMAPYKGVLSEQQIADVAAFVFDSAQG
jgi:cytochrome c2